MSKVSNTPSVPERIWFRGRQVHPDTAGLWFLAERMVAHQDHQHPRCWGASSDALAAYGVGIGQRPQTPGWSDSPNGGCWSGDECGREYPHDDSDLMACEITYRMAPRHVQERMLPVLDEFRRWIDHGLNRYGVEHPYHEQVAA